MIVAVAPGRLVLVELAHEVVGLILAPCGDHPEKPIIAARIQGDLTVAPFGVEQIFPLRGNIRSFKPVNVVGNGVVVVVKIDPATLLVSKLLRIGR